MIGRPMRYDRLNLNTNHERASRVVPFFGNRLKRADNGSRQVKPKGTRTSIPLKREAPESGSDQIRIELHESL